MFPYVYRTKDLVCHKPLIPSTSQEETDDSTNRMEYTDSEAETEYDYDEPKPKRRAGNKYSKCGNTGHNKHSCPC